MSLEVLNLIREAEQKAEEVRQDAVREARDIIKSVEGACAMQERSAAIEQRAEYQAILEKDRKQVEVTLKKEAEKNAEALKALSKQAEGRLDAAASLIFERVVKHGDR